MRTVLDLLKPRLWPLLHRRPAGSTRQYVRLAVIEALSRLEEDAAAATLLLAAQEDPSRALRRRAGAGLEAAVRETLDHQRGALETLHAAADRELSSYGIQYRNAVDAELPDLLRLAADIGVGELHLQRLVYFQDHEGYGVAKCEQTLQDSDDASLELIHRSRELAARLGIQFNASGLSNPLESVQPNSAVQLPWRKCYRSQTLMYITANGNVLPCCISPFSTTDFASILLGNAFESSLAEIWSGPKYTNFRNQLHTESPPKCCRGCGVLWSL